MIDALANGQVDIAVAWGPRPATTRDAPTCRSTSSPAPDETSVPESFAIAIAVRDDASALRDALNAALVRSGHGSTPLLAEYDVPLLPLGRAPSGAAMMSVRRRAWLIVVFGLTTIAGCERESRRLPPTRAGRRRRRRRRRPPR